MDHAVLLSYDKYIISFDMDKKERAKKVSNTILVNVDFENSIPGYVVFNGWPRVLSALHCDASICEQLQYADEENTIFLIDIIIAHEHYT